MVGKSSDPKVRWRSLTCIPVISPAPSYFVTATASMSPSAPTMKIVTTSPSFMFTLGIVQVPGVVEPVQPITTRPSLPATPLVDSAPPAPPAPAPPA